MKNQAKNILTITILLLILFTLLFGISNLKKSNNMNAFENNPSSNKTERPAPFKYENARVSNISGINFENNFGGKNDDEIFKTYKLNNLIIIGKTNSNDYYFDINSNNNHHLFIQMLDNNGNCLNIYTYELKTNFKFINSIISNNSIYLLIQDNLIKVIEYNLTTNQFNLKTNLIGTGLDLIYADDLCLIYNNNNQTKIHYCNSNYTFNIKYKINKIYMLSNYLNGIIAYTQSDNKLQILYITPNSLKLINEFPCEKLETFNITKENIFLITKNSYLTKVIMLNNDFQQTNEIIVDNGSNYKINKFGNFNILSYIYNNKIIQQTFCSCGNILTNSIIFNNSQYFDIILNKNKIYYITNSTNNILTLFCSNPINDIVEKTIISAFNDITINNYEINNNLNLLVFANYHNVNSIISKNYGNLDYGVFEIKLN